MTGNRPLPPLALDAALALAVAVAALLAMVGRVEEGGRPPDARSTVLALGVAGLVMVRRRWPLPVLLATSGLLFLYHALNYPPITLGVPLAVALYTAAAQGHLRLLVVLVSAMASVTLAWRGVIESEPVVPLVEDLIREVALLAAVLLLGETVRSRRAWAAEVAQREQRTQSDREAAGRRQLADERVRIARELHDVVAHTVAVISVQAAVAAEVLDDDPDQAREALRAVRRAGREATAELQATIGLLRGEEADSPGLAPAPGLGQLAGLVGSAHLAGLGVHVRTDGPARPLPAAVDLTAYRIVQESLTNVVRHAGARRAEVGIRYGEDRLVVEVTDDGRGAPDPSRLGGHGLDGMRERAAALGGWLEVGTAPTGGFRVRALLPCAAT